MSVTPARSSPISPDRQRLSSVLRRFGANGATAPFGLCANDRFPTAATSVDAIRNVRFTEGFRTPALCRRAGTGRGAGVRKPRKEETAERKRRGLAGRELWGFWGRGGIAHVAAEVEGGRCYREERTRRAFSGARMRAAGVYAAAGESLQRSRGHRVRAPACGWRRRRSALRGGKRGDCHEVSILIGVGDDECAGRTPSKVSTMIIRPPQQGQRRPDESPSVSRSSKSQSVSAGERSGAASAWRTRSMLRARTVPAKRP
jgi:hypothetical protein